MVSDTNLFQALLISLWAGVVFWPAHAAAEDARRQPGAELFAQHCARCHGIGGRGTAGIPDLTDGVWQFGGSYQDIEHSITYGRSAVMPGLGNAVGKQGLDQVVEYVRSLSEPVAPSSDRLTAGRELYSTFCASCHGEDGAGTLVLGARDLTNGIWLYGGSADEIRDVVVNGRASDMPAQRELLDPEEIRLLASYVMSLSDVQPDE